MKLVYPALKMNFCCIVPWTVINAAAEKRKVSWRSHILQGKGTKQEAKLQKKKLTKTGHSSTSQEKVRSQLAPFPLKYSHTALANITAVLPQLRTPV